MLNNLVTIRHIKIYGQFKEDTLEAVLLSYRKNLVYYAKKVTISDEMVNLIKCLDYDVISGKFELMEALKQKVPYMREKPIYFAELKTLKNQSNQAISVKVADVVEDLIAADDMLDTIEEFGDIEQVHFIEANRYKLVADVLDKFYMVYDDNKKCIATATTAATNSMNTMVLGVATTKHRRREGFASAMLTQIIKDYLAAKKSHCLFYDNPAADKIYQRLGFEPLGKWMMLINLPQNQQRKKR